MSRPLHFLNHRCSLHSSSHGRGIFGGQLSKFGSNSMVIALFLHQRMVIALFLHQRQRVEGLVGC